MIRVSTCWFVHMDRLFKNLPLLIWTIVVCEVRTCCTDLFSFRLVHRIRLVPYDSCFGVCNRTSMSKKVVFQILP